MNIVVYMVDLTPMCILKFDYCDWNESFKLWHGQSHFVCDYNVVFDAICLH